MVRGNSIDPWSSEQSTDYGRMIEQFGLTPMDFRSIPNPGMLHRRGIVFAHRDMGVITDSITKGGSIWGSYWPIA